MFKPIDLTGRTYGDWTVLKRTGPSKRFYWLCQCVCGNQVDVHVSSLTHNRSSRCSNCRKVAIDETVFDAPLTDDAFYWLGFLMADGCVHDAVKDSWLPRISVGLSVVDLPHLHKLKTFLKSSCKIYEYDDGASCGLQVHSQKLCDVLAVYGVVPRKSLVAEALNGAEHNASFWRGLLDGDGHINEARCSLGLCGGKRLMEQFRDFIKSELNIRVSVAPQDKEKRLWYARAYSSNAVAILELLYGKEAATALTRKYEKAIVLRNKARKYYRNSDRQYITRNPVG